MNQPPTILQPTATELLKFMELAASRGHEVQFTVSIKPISPLDELTTKQAVEFLKISTRKITSAVADGILRPTRCNGKNIFIRKHLQAARDQGLI